MIKSRLSILMGIKKVNIQDIHIATGLNRNTISDLYHDKRDGVSYETIGKICEYFNCQVGELLERE